jgi:NitT/TauT family transport system permease protein
MSDMFTSRTAGQPRTTRSSWAPRRGPRSRTAAVVPPLMSVLAIIGIWYFFSSRLKPNRKFLLPPPHDIVTKGLLNAKARSEILSSLLLTAELALVGLLIAVVLGMAVGLAMYRFEWLERASYPVLVALQAVPILAISPLMTLAFGYGFGSKCIVCVIISFFPIPTNLLLGLKSVEPGMHDLMTLHGAPWRVRILKLSLPNALPYLFTAFRISAGLSVIGAIVGEQFFQQGKPGLGQRLIEYRVVFEFERLYATLLVSSLLGISVYLAFTFLGHRLTRHWHASST